MRKPACLLLAAVLSLAIPAAASAGPLVSASLTLLLQVGDLPPVTLPSVGATGTSTSSLSATLGAGTAFNASVTTTIPTTAAPPITVLSVKVTKNAALSWNDAPASAAFQGVATLKGLGGLTLLSIPLNLGSPNTFSKSGGGMATTVISGAWTAGVASVTGLISSTPQTAMLTGANNLTAGGAGTLVLVTPMKIASGVFGYRAAFGVLTLNYIPEPGTLLLVGLGVAGLAARGRHLRRR